MRGETPPGVRVDGYERHLNVVAPGQTLRIHISGLSGPTAFEASYRKLTRETGGPGTRVVAALGTLSFAAGGETAAGTESADRVVVRRHP